MVYGILHQLIEQSQWDDILESLPTIIADASELHRQDLPLHMACERGAPVLVLQRLLQAYPQAAQHAGRGENWCLHIAAHRNLPTQFMESLIREYPEALDGINAAHLTPRNIGHVDIHAFQALRRPTTCWHQLMEDEQREEQQEQRLKVLHSTVDAAITDLDISETTFQAMMKRIEQVATRLQELEVLQQERHMMDTVRRLKESLQTRVQRMDYRVTSLEDDLKAAATKEFMSKAAARAQQSQVVRMQKRATEQSKLLKGHLEAARQELEQFEIQPSM